jgi:hypothetical protein
MLIRTAHDRYWESFSELPAPPECRLHYRPSRHPHPVRRKNSPTLACIFPALPGLTSKVACSRSPEWPLDRDRGPEHVEGLCYTEHSNCQFG